MITSRHAKFYESWCHLWQFYQIISDTPVTHCRHVALRHSGAHIVVGNFFQLVSGRKVNFNSIL
jgi:hypothetical protein